MGAALGDVSSREERRDRLACDEAARWFGLRIEHVGLWVADLASMRDFYVQSLGGEAGPIYANSATGFRSCFITFDSGGRLELMTRAASAALGRDDAALGWAHLALALPDEEAVVATTARLQHSGCVLASAPRRTGDGQFESVVLDPEGNRIELVAG
jgi:lactoylglutathione lyase